MDTISRENNSMLPMAGIIVGGIGLIIGIYAAITAGNIKRHLTDDYDPKIAQIDDIRSQVSAADAAANQANSSINELKNGIQTAFNEVGTQIGDLKKSVADMQAAATRPSGGHGRRGAEGPVVAGPGEYVVKPGDSGMKIARANGVSLHALMAVNPGVNWHRLHPGEKIKLPVPKGSAPGGEEAPAEAPAPAPAPGA